MGEAVGGNVDAEAEVMEDSVAERGSSTRTELSDMFDGGRIYNSGLFEAAQMKCGGIDGRSGGQCGGGSDGRLGC
jgi:hypothetical protein